MSRGLGTRQRIFLAAINQLEIELGPGKWFYVWAIINTAGKLGLDAELTERKAREDVAWAEYKEAERLDRIETEALARAGDAAAKERLDILLRLDFLAGALRMHCRKKDWLGAPKMRDPVEAERFVNPTRVLALLQKRGLIERDVS